MRKKTLAAGAAASLLVVGSLGAHAQKAPSPKAAGPPDVPAKAPASRPAGLTDVPALEYDTSFVPFTDAVWTRVHDAPITLPPPSLFDPFDPAAALDPYAQASRVAIPGDHPVASMPLLEVKVGQTFDVPISVSYSRPLTSLRVVLAYNTDVLQPVNALGTGIPTEDLFINTNVHLQGKDFKGYLIAFTTFTTPWTRGGPIMRLRFKAVAPGESILRTALTDVSNDKLEMVVATMRPGLVRVTP